MKKIITNLRHYVASLHPTVFLLSALFTTLLVYLNYGYGLNRLIYRQPHWLQFFSWYGVFLTAFGVGYWIQDRLLKRGYFSQKNFLALLLLAPAIFSLKMMIPVHFSFTNDVFRNEYWNAVIYWPLKVIGITVLLLAVHHLFNKEEPFYGVTVAGFSSRPYLLMLLFMVPLVAAASTQSDFLRMYPRFQHIEYLMLPGRGGHKLLFELSYGLDFFSIELFFRGFLVLAFAKYAGRDALLPMAIFYCTIHFGKPLGECISSFFGGLILGVVSYHTRSIFGGFLVHVGIAWLMELGGILGREHLFG